MSLTAEVQTQRKLGGLHHTNSSTISVRASSPHPPDYDSSGLRKLHPSREDIELAELPDARKPVTEGEIGEKAPADDAQEVKPQAKLTAWLQFSALCFTLFLAGWNDGTTGPLLPRIQSNYHVRTSTDTIRHHNYHSNCSADSRTFRRIGGLCCGLPDLHFQLRGKLLHAPLSWSVLSLLFNNEIFFRGSWVALC